MKREMNKLSTDARSTANNDTRDMIGQTQSSKLYMTSLCLDNV